MSIQAHSLEGEELLTAFLAKEYAGRIAVSSSFGAESAVLLDMVARIDPHTPVIFLDTGKHFPETLEYVALLQQRLGLSDIRMLRPDVLDVSKVDPEGMLYASDPDACCALRKTAPLSTVLEEFDVWITGRKRFHGGKREALATIEEVDGRLKLNPLAGWSEEQIDEAFDQRGLPRHPLVFEGYQSLGCAPCTRKSSCPGNVRAGRWAGTDKTECGIHTQSI